MRLLRQGVAGLSQIGQFPIVGQLANLGLGKSALGQRAFYLPLAAGPHAGPVIAQIVQVAAVGHDGHVQRLGQACRPA